MLFAPQSTVTVIDDGLAPTGARHARIPVAHDVELPTFVIAVHVRPALSVIVSDADMLDEP